MARTPISRNPAQRAKKGEPPSLNWARWVEDSIRRLVDLSDRVQTPVYGGGARDVIQFKVYGVRYDTTEEAWFCKIRPGYVRNVNPDSDATEPVKDWMPTAPDLTALDEEEAPEFEIADGQTVYCRVESSNKEIITVAPTIVVANTPEAGTHYQPPDASVTGDLYYPIANIEIAGDPEVVTVTQIQQGGPIVIRPNLPELKNIGGEIEIYAGRISAGDTYDLRTLEQLTGSGKPIIKPEDPLTDTIKFRGVKEKASSPQVRVNAADGDDEIEIRGNGYDSSESSVRMLDLSSVDGLVTSITKGIAGVHGAINFYHTPNVGSDISLTINIVDGSIVSVTGGTSNTGDWDEDVPGFADFITQDDV
jgi:hypothetical protein